MSGIVLQKHSILPFDEQKSDLLSMKPSKTDEYKYSAGEIRLRIELEGKPKEVIDGYVKKYRELCDMIYSIMKEVEIGPDDEKKFAIAICSLLYSNMDMKYKKTDFLYQFVDTLGSKTPELDCDTSAFLVFDIGARLGIAGLEIVYVPEHMFVRTKNWAIETTVHSPRNCIFPISELDKQYPLRYMSTSDIGKIESFSFKNLGMVKNNLGDYTGAIVDFSVAIRLNPKFADAFACRGLAKENSGDHKGAIADYTEALALGPKNADIYNNLGVSKINLGDYESAIEDYSEAIRLNPKFALAFSGRGSAKDDLGDIKGAISDYGESIKLSPEYADAYYNRALARKKLGDEKGRDADMEMYEKLTKKK